MIIRTYKSALPSRFRPRLEILENRSLLSHCTVSVLTDTGEKGDLRYCITQAADGDTISFKVSGTISLTRALPALTHSISIEGPEPDTLTVRRDTGGNYRIFMVGSLSCHSTSFARHQTIRLFSPVAVSFCSG